jgi:GNAT superfamily N-acetyltransferase
VLEVTKAIGEDVIAMARLLQEMDDFYGDKPMESIEAKAEQINAVLFSDQPLAYALLARDGSQTVGLAAYSFLWPAMRSTKSLYLKELYVSKHYRRGGIGKLMMKKLLEVAIDNGCSRVEWTTDEDNEEARRFYEVLGFESLSSKLFYRVEGQDSLRAFNASVIDN